MKSIQNQYIDLKEGRMSQANFMRNVRMTLPQYVTNVTSFKDTVRILKNKAILNEAMGDDPIEATLKSYLAKGNSYAEAIELTAAEQGMDEEVLMSQYPQDAVDTEGYEDEGDDEEFIDMIAKAEKDKEEEEAIKSGFGIYDPLEEDDDEDEAPEDYEDPDMFDAYGMDASEGLKTVKEPNPNADKYRITSIDGKMVIAKDFFDSMEAAQEYARKNIRTSYKIVKLPAERSVYKKIDEGKKKREPKAELHPNQIHPQELRMGIKVELEHTDDLDKAKKIALDHLAENPFYYTALKLSGIESPSAPKAKYPVAFKKEVTAAVELVDKINAMKPVKGIEKAKASSNKARKETNKIVKGVEELTHNAQTVRGLQKFAATGGKMKTVKSIYEAKFNAMPGEKPNATVQRAMGFIQSNPVLRQISDLITLQNDGENAILRYDYYKALPDEAYNKLELQFFVEDDFEGSDEDGGDDFETSGGTQNKIAYILYPKKKAGNLGASLEMGASKASKMDAFKESLEKLVREVLDEMYDGGDDMSPQYAQDETK